MNENQNPDKQKNSYITLSEASQLSGISRDYLNVLIRREKLRAIKIGKNWLTTKDWISTLRASRGGIKTGDDQYLSLFNAARIANVSAGYLNVAVRRGKLRAVKLGRNWFTTNEWLSEYQKAAGRVSSAIPFFTEREKQLQTEALLPEIKLFSRELKSEEKSIILESAFAKAAADKAVKEQFKSADVSEFKKVSKQLGILKSLKSWSYFKFSLASGLVVLILVISLSAVSGLISLPNLPNFNISTFKNFSGLNYQASIFSDVFKNFPSDLPSFSRWFTLSLSKGLTLFKSKSLSELAVETLESGKSKLLKLEEAPYPINTLAEAETLDSPSESAQLAEAEGEIPAGGLIVSVGGSEFRLLENRLSVVETDLKDQTDLINSELSLQKKTILGVIETMFGIAKLVPAHPISTIVVQGQPATLTSYSVRPQVNTGFDRLSASYLTLSNNAEINGSLTVKSGGTFDRLSVSGATTLTGNATIGGTLSVTGDTTLNNLTLNGTLSLPGSATLGNASSTYLTVSNTGWLNQLKITGTATTTFNSPITSSSGNLIVAADSANNILLNPYGGNVGIGTSSPNNLLTIAGAATPSLGLTTNSGLSGWTMGIDTADANKFKIASSTAVGTNARLTIDGNGNVGIGTTSPGSLLSVHSTGNVYLGGDLTVSGAVTFQSSTSFSSGFNLTGIFTQTASSTSSIISSVASSTATHYSFDARGAGAIFNILKNNSSKFYIDNLGNVGIATTTVPSGFGFNIATSTYIYGNQFISGGLGVGLATTTSGAIQTSGDVFVGRNLYVSGSSVTLGASTADSLTVNSSINSNLIPDQNALRNFGSSAFYWKGAFIDTLTVNNISAASTTIAGTQSETFTINSDNNSLDSQNAEIIFYRGTVVPNALFTWNSATSSKRFELNQVLYINNGSASTTNPTFTIKTIANQTANALQIIDNNSSAYFTVNPIGSNTTIVNASSTNFSVSGSTFLSNATTTGLSVNGGTLLGSLSAANATFANATSTGGFSVTGGTQLNSLAFTVGTSTSFGVTGGTSLGSLNVSGLSALGNISAGNATTTGLTVSGGTLLGSLSAGAITVTSCNGCGIGGNNSLQNTYNSSTSSPQIILSSAGQNGLFIQDSALGLHLPLFQINGQSGTSTLFSVSATSTNWGVGALMQNATTTGLTVNGGTLLGSLSAANATFSNATSTGGFSVTGGTQLNSLAFTVGTSTSFGVTGGTSLGSLNVSGLSALGNISAGNATTTGLTVSGGTLLGSLVASNATFTTATTSALSVTGGSSFAAASFSGNVGIGRTRPLTTLHIASASGVTIDKANVSDRRFRLVIGTGAADAINGITYPNHSAIFISAGQDFNFVNGSGEDQVAMIIKNSGNVGIGTTTPNNLLSISSATTPAVGFTTATGFGWTVGMDTADSNKFKIASSTAVGTNARLTIDGSGNVGIGTTTPNNLLGVYQLIDFNNTDRNTKLGYQAGLNIVSGAVDNTFVGYQTGLSGSGGTTDAAYNTAIGYQSFYSNTTGTANAAVGRVALNKNTTGGYNVAIGMNALRDNTTGGSNVAVGYATLFVNTTGGSNTAIGNQSLYSNTTGGSNTALGNQAGYSNTTGSNNIIIGANTNLPAVDSSNMLSIGNLIYATGLTAFGTPSSAVSSGNVGIGTTTPGSLLSVHSTGNVYFGGNLTVSGNSLFQNATTTGLSVNGGTLLGSLSAGAATTTSLSVTGGGLFGALGVTGNSNLGNATTTGLTVNGGTLLGSLVASNATFTTATTSALSVTGGSQFAAASFSGNVGIGTAAPSYLLDIRQLTNQINPLVMRRASDGSVALNFNIDSGGTGEFEIRDTSSVIQVSLTGATGHYFRSGNVGIGTTSPGQLLSVAGNAHINNNFSVVGGSVLSNATTTGLSVNGGTLLGSLAFGNATGTALTVTGGTKLGALDVNNGTLITVGGNVGIGTASPRGILDVVTAGSSAVVHLQFGSVGEIDFRNGPGSAGTDRLGVIQYNNDVPSGTLGFRFWIKDDGGTEAIRMMIRNDGSVGIGTTTPNNLLSISSATTPAVGFTTATGFGWTVGMDTADSNKFKIASSTAVGTNARLTIDGNGNVGIASTSPSAVLSVNVSNATGVANALNITSATSSLLYVRSDGNVGIGTAGPRGILDIVSPGGGSVGIHLQMGTGQATSIQFRDGPGSAGTDRQAYFQYRMDTTPDRFELATKNTGGTEGVRMVLDQDGNVGIGTTTPTQLLTISKAGATANANIPNGWLCVDNDGGCVGGTAGSIYYVAAVTGNSDVAENYYSNDLLEAGEIVQMKTTGGLQIEKAHSTSSGQATSTSQTIIGVISTSPGNLLGYNAEMASTSYPVALAGRVPVKVSLENGQIAIGDRVSASSIAGVGKKASSTEATVGMALEPFDGTTPSSTSDVGETLTSDVIPGVGKILVFVNLGQPRLSGAQGTGDLASMITASSDLNMNGFSILNVKSITGMNGLWKIDENGNIMAQSVETQKLTVGGGIASGVTIYDRETAAPKCIYIEGGVIKTSDGACGATTNSGTPVVIETASAPVPTATSTSSVSEIAATTTPVIATSTEPVIVSTTTPETATSTP